MNYEKSPIPWKARPIYPNGELGWMVEASNGAVIASGLPKEIAEDGIHPTKFGYAKMEEILMKSMK